jgi:hypothetical protein
VGFANNLFPADMLPMLTINPSGNYTIKESNNVGIGMTTMKCSYKQCALCYPEATKKNTDTPKEIDVTVTLTAATAAFKESVKAKAENNKATIEVNYYPYGSGDTSATLNLYVPSAYGEDQYVNLRLNADDLKALQDAIYKVRVEIAKAEVKNDEVYPF